MMKRNSRGSYLSLLLAAGLAVSACSDDSASVADQGQPADGLDAGADAISSDATNGTDGQVFVDAGVGGYPGDGACGGEAVTAEEVKVNLLVIIDRSGSMNQTPDGFAETKWDTMVTSVQTALAGIQHKMSLGLLFFPDPLVESADGCGMTSGTDLPIEVQPGATAMPLITAKLQDAANRPAGNTPTADALAVAHAYFTTGPGAALEGEKHVLLALDGGPNCNEAITCDAAACTTNIDRSATDPQASSCPIDPASCCGDGTDPALNKSCLDDARTIAQVESLAEAGIGTFVVGIPGSGEYAQVLDALAVAGGHSASATSPQYFEVTDAQELTATLVSITTNLVKICEFQLDRTPPDPNKVNVFIDGEVVPQEGDDGWEYDNSTNPPTIIIKGETCEQLKTEGAENVTFEFGCPTVK